MKAADGNPESNKLGAGVTEKELLDAIGKSGYPLQTIVASQLDPEFIINEEWSYIDKETGDERNIDILAEKWLFDWRTNPDRRVRPTLDLLIECKKSELPYVFFLSRNDVWLKQFPIFAGLFNEELKVKTQDNPATFLFSFQQAFGLQNHPFAKLEEHCMSFTRCARNSKLVVRGDEPFNEIVLPLIKAMNHLREHQKPPATALYFDFHIVFAISVLDAPMLAVRVGDKDNELFLTPWVRVLRHNTVDAEYAHDRKRLHGIDIVHKDFFRTYLINHLLPYARTLASKAEKHDRVLASGEAFVSELGKREPNIEPYLEPTNDKQ